MVEEDLFEPDLTETDRVSRSKHINVEKERLFISSAKHNTANLRYKPHSQATREHFERQLNGEKRDPAR